MELQGRGPWLSRNPEILVPMLNAAQCHSMLMLYKRIIFL